jgi:hypothetical protein
LVVVGVVRDEVQQARWKRGKTIMGVGGLVAVIAFVLLFAGVASGGVTGATGVFGLLVFVGVVTVLGGLSMRR